MAGVQNLFKFMPHYRQLGKFLKLKRMHSDFSQSELAEQIDIHPQFVSNWERGICAPPSHSFKRLIKLLKINRNELVEVMVEDCRRSIEERVFGKVKSSAKASKSKISSN